MGDTEKTFARFDSLIARHRALIDHLCIRYSDNDAELCNDYRQDCYCSLWHYLPSLKENSNYFQERSWVAWHCRSVFSHHNERNRKRQFIPLTKEIADSAVESDNNEARETIEALAVTSPLTNAGPFCSSPTATTPKTWPKSLASSTAAPFLCDTAS